MQPLQRELVGGIVLHGAPEFRHGNDLIVIGHGLVATLQGLHHQFLAGELAGGEVVHTMRI